MKNPDRNSVTRLRDLPNIGPAVACDLELLGISHPAMLIDGNAFELHERLCSITGEKQDPCLIDVFMSVIDFMEGGEPRPWWSFTETRKQLLWEKK